MRSMAAHQIRKRRPRSPLATNRLTPRAIRSGEARWSQPSVKRCASSYAAHGVQSASTEPPSSVPQSGPSDDALAKFHYHGSDVDLPAVRCDDGQRLPLGTKGGHFVRGLVLPPVSLSDHQVCGRGFSRGLRTRPVPARRLNGQDAPTQITLEDASFTSNASDLLAIDLASTDAAPYGRPNTCHSRHETGAVRQPAFSSPVC
jgi:hypothetical protein